METSHANESLAPLARRQRLALCVAGALRSFTVPEVALGFWRTLRDNYDVFFHVFVGEELSERGQSLQTNDLLSTALALRNATANATRVNVQFRENNFLCGQMTTGRFSKIAGCARVALAHAAEHNVSYGLFVSTRPDLMYKRRFPERCLLDAHGDVKQGFYDISNEAVFAPFLSVERTFATLADPQRMQCCNLTSRTPPQCFWGTQLEPDPNFLFMRHLESNGLTRVSRRQHCDWPNVIERGKGPKLHASQLSRLAGKYRSHVERRATADTVSLDDFIFLLQAGGAAHRSEQVRPL